MTVTEELLVQFQTLGMSEAKAKETLKNANVTSNLQKALYECRGIELSEGVGMLLYHLASKIKPQTIDHLPLLVKYVVSKKLDNTLRVDAALEYLLSHGYQKDSVNTSEMENACGVGIVITPEEIDKAVEEEIRKHKEDILQQRYRFNVGKVMQEVRNKLKWADGKAIKNEVEVQIFDLLGPKTEEDLKPAPKPDKKKEKAPKIQDKPDKPDKGGKPKEKDQTSDGANTIAELMKTKVHFHAPGENYKTDGYVVTANTDRLLKEHLKITEGKVRTRFPPEPNGILHIGHAKAININFGYAAAHDGVCFLRYDDTNPEKEEEKFFIGIKDMVEWLGYKPFQITHSSDYFKQLYEWAIVLIKKGHAYVCHQSSEEIKGFNPPPSPWRDRPIEESLRLFEDMKNGKIDEGKATLRMRVTLEEGKMDPVAYRIKFLPHHRTKDEWCIYPTYDYTHCLCDSIENITHSLCTKEFQSRRSSYYWLCNALDIYCPVQWEYGRLNVNYTVVSKRKIGKLITENIVSDWDDPRLFTLTALRRRGFPAEAINNFCAQMGVTGAQVTVDPQMLESCVRDVLNLSAPRVLAVLEPLKISLIEFPSEKPIEIDVPYFPQDPERGSRKIVFDRVIYIDQSDFKLEGEPGYRRLTPKQSVGLRYTGYVITIVKFIAEGNGNVKEIICRCDDASTVGKPKAFIQWVSDPMEAEVRLYEPLFKHPNPEDPKLGGFINDVNKDSLVVLKSYVEKSLVNAAPFDKFQFERCGYFSVDPNSTKDKIVFNRTVTLKEDAGKV